MGRRGRVRAGHGLRRLEGRITRWIVHRTLWRIAFGDRVGIANRIFGRGHVDPFSSFFVPSALCGSGRPRLPSRDLPPASDWKRGLA